MSLDKYDCQVANIAFTARMLYGHIDPRLFSHIHQTQLTATVASHVIAMCMPETNMPAEFGTYPIHAKHFM